MSNRLDLDRLNRDPSLVACAASADEVFSFLTRQISVPASCVALVRGPSGQPAVLSAGKEIDKDRATELLFVRATPFELEYAISGLPSKDGYECSASVQMTVQIAPERTELEAFRRSLLGSRREVGLARLHHHFEEAVRAALGAFVKARDAADLIAPDRWGEFDAVLAEHFKPVGFESGMTLGPDPRVALSSPAYTASQKEQQAAMLREERAREEQRLREAAAKERQAHLAELETMLEKVKAMADRSGILSVPELIQTFDVAQRGRLYHGLMSMAAPSRRTEAVLVVAGSELLRFQPADVQKPDRRQKLPNDAGALRSVRLAGQPDDDRILVGARYGVHLIEGEAAEVRTCVMESRPGVRGGFNSVVLRDDRIFASHSEIGLIAWSLEKPNVPHPCLTELTAGSRSVRDVQTDAAGRLWLSVDDLVIGWNPDEEGSQSAWQAPKEVTALTVADGYAFGGLRDGAVVRWPLADGQHMETIREPTGPPVTSLAWLSGGGVPRLLIGEGRQYLTLHVIGDSYTGQYRCPHELRWGFAAADLIVGVNDRRDHLFLWHVDDPRLPASSVSIRRLTGRSIQDVALL